MENFRHKIETEIRFGKDSIKDLRNMDFFDLLFGGGQAIQGIFRLGFIPKEEDFREFSGEEYQKFKEKECDICGKMYTFKSGLPIAEHDVYVFSEEEKGIMLKGVDDNTFNWTLDFSTDIPESVRNLPPSEIARQSYHAQRTDTPIDSGFSSSHFQKYPSL